MPYDVIADATGCDGWAVVKSDTREVVACHATEAEAERQQRALCARERIGGDAARPSVATAPLTFTLADPSQRAMVATLERQSRQAAERRAVERVSRPAGAKQLALSARQRLLARSQHRAESRHVSEARRRRAAAARARMMARPHPTVAEPTAWFVPDELTRGPR